MLTGILAGLAAGALWGVVFVAPRMVPGFSSVDLSAGALRDGEALSIGDLVKEAIADQADLIKQLEQYIRGE